MGGGGCSLARTGGEPSSGGRHHLYIADVTDSTQQIPGAKVWHREGELLGHELTTLTHYLVTGLIEESRRAKTVEQHIELQRKLASAGWEARDLAHQIKARKKELAAELRTAKQQGTMDRVVDISRTLRDFDLTLDVNRRRWYALRAVQDGIIWRLLAYNRHRIAVLSEGTPVTVLSDSFPSECAAAEKHWAEGRLAVFCDLSNCINSGDLLIFDTRKQQIIVMEVKESERSSEDTRQQESLRLKIEFLNSGRSEVVPDVPMLGPDRIPPLKTHLSILQHLLARAARRGFAMAKAGEAAAIYALDARGVDWADVSGELPRHQERKRAFDRRLGLAWAPPTTTRYEFDTLTKVRRDESHAVGGMAPYSIFPFDAETCAALLLGIAGYRTVLNVDVIESYLANKGWSILRPKDEDRFARGFLWVARDNHRVCVPHPIAEQLLVELLSVPAFEASVRAAWHRVREADSEQVKVGWAWAEEERVWQ
jgi:hypothetical protein